MTFQASEAFGFSRDMTYDVVLRMKRLDLLDPPKSLDQPVAPADIVIDTLISDPADTRTDHGKDKDDHHKQGKNCPDGHNGIDHKDCRSKKDDDHTLRQDHQHILYDSYHRGRIIEDQLVDIICV